MKFDRFYIAFLLSLFLTMASIGQEPTTAVLVDEHGMLPCDDNLGRIDAWYAELATNPSSLGLVVISSPLKKKHLSVFRELMMKTNAKFRGAESLAIKYLRANSEDGFRVQLWRIPAGAIEPEIESLDLSYALPTDIEPFILGADYEIDDVICPGVSDSYVFAEFLQGNPRARGNIVARNRTLRGARREGSKILKEFQIRYGIPSSRLRVFPRKSLNLSNNSEPIVEYWYLP
jgi:hypothetical protein